MMSDTRPDIILLAGVQTDIYAALNAQVGFPAVTIGVQIAVQAKGSNPIYLTTKATIPTDTDGSNKLTPNNDEFVNVVGSSGEWALSIATDSLINVRVI